MALAGDADGDDDFDNKILVFPISSPSIAEEPVPARKQIYPVPLIGQTSALSCAYACGRMIQRWSATARPPSKPYGQEIDTPLAVAAAEQAGGVGFDKIGAFAEYFCFDQVAPPRTANELVSLLLRHGPLWCPHKYNPKAANVPPEAKQGHAFVLTGFEMDQQGRLVIWINDPLPIGTGSRKSIAYHAFMVQLVLNWNFLHA